MIPPRDIDVAGFRFEECSANSVFSLQLSLCGVPAANVRRHPDDIARWFARSHVQKNVTN